MASSSVEDGAGLSLSVHFPVPCSNRFSIASEFTSLRDAVHDPKTLRTWISGRPSTSLSAGLQDPPSYFSTPFFPFTRRCHGGSCSRAACQMSRHPRLSVAKPHARLKSASLMNGGSARACNVATGQETMQLTAQHLANKAVPAASTC